LGPKQHCRPKSEQQTAKMPAVEKKVKNEAESEDSEEETEDAPFGNGLDVSEIMKNPLLMAAVQDKLQGLVGTGSGYIDNLPKSIKNRINALKNIQVECAKIEGKFYEEAHELEMKYAELFKPLYEKRTKIVNALYEPTEEECKFTEFGEEDEDEEEAAADKVNREAEEAKSEEEKIAVSKDEVMSKLKLDEDTKGIPEFWLTAMKNVETLSEMIQPHDEAILKHVTDIQLIFTGRKQGEEATEDNEMGFVLEFQFSENEHFTNTALTKTYKMKSEPDPEDPFSFDGPDIVGCTGCQIDWKSKEKNVTQKTVKKKQKHKGRGQTRIITKTVKNDSFFNFFEPPEVPENEDDIDEDTEALLAADFEIGHFFRERLIPKGVLFFTGEAIEEDSDDEYEDDDEDEEGDDDDDDENEENDPDFVPPADGGKPQECKQQ